MILLHRLLIQNFKQLADVELAFPDSGTILIEGKNEAGKSSLFEAVFFALYGQPLLTDRNFKLTDLRSYGAEELRVELEFSIGERCFHIARRLGKNHTVKLTCPAADEEETITNLNEVRRRVQEELRLSPDALLNTCFVEQKRLERLEDLDANARRATINELLNLRVLTQLENEFRITVEDRAQLQYLEARVAIAKLDAALPALQEAAEQTRCNLLRARLQATLQQGCAVETAFAQAHDKLQINESLCREVAETLRTADDLVARLSTIETDLTLRARAWGEAVRARGQVEAELAQLANKERELPLLQSRLQQWRDLAEQLSVLESLEQEADELHVQIGRLQTNLRRHSELQRAWEETEAQRTQLIEQSQHDSSAVTSAETALVTRQTLNERSSQLALFRQQLSQYTRASREAEELGRRIEASNAEIEQLPRLRSRLAELENVQLRLRQQQEDEGELERVENALVAEEKKLADLSNLEQQREDSQTAQEQLQTQLNLSKQKLRRERQRGMVALISIVASIALIITGWWLHALITGTIGAALAITSVMLLTNSGRNGRGLQVKIENTRRQSDDLQRTLHALEVQIQVRKDAGHEQELFDLQEQRESLRLALRQCGDIVGVLSDLDVPETLRQESRAALSVALETAIRQCRQDLAYTEAVARTLANLESGYTSKLSEVREEKNKLQSLAQQFDIPGSTVDLQKQAVIEELSRLQEQAEKESTATLSQHLETVRTQLTHTQQELKLLEYEQAKRLQELQSLDESQLILQLTSILQQAAQNENNRQQLATLRDALQQQDLPTEAAPLHARLAVASDQLRRAQQETGRLREEQSRLVEMEELELCRQAEFAIAWSRLLDEPVPPDAELALNLLTAHATEVERSLQAIDINELRHQSIQWEAERRDLERQTATMEHELAVLRHQALTQAEECNFSFGNSFTAALVEFGGDHHTTPATADSYEQALHECMEAMRDNRSQRRAQAEALSLGDELLDSTATEAALAEWQRQLAVKRRAGEIVGLTRTSIVNRVMPLTMQNMRQLLPLLTEGRYADVQWDEENNYLAVYDSRAGAFMRKRVFSGGARDQISLALRLAFALATLPGEHNARPGWLFLDEPLSSFDRSRSLALVELLTQGVIRRQFAQIFLVSHSEAFDPDQFDYRIKLDSGRIIENTLP